MEYFEFVLKLFEVIAWPLLTFAVLFLFRRDIGTLLGVIKTLGLKHNDTEIGMTFRRELKAIDIEPEAPDPADSVEQLARKNPKAAILESWEQMENVASLKCEELSLTGTEHVKIKRGRALNLIQFSGVFSPVIKQALTQLGRLKFSAEKNANMSVSSEEALNYIRVARVVTKQIEALTTIPQFRLISLTYLILEYNALLDTQKYTHITIADIHREIENHSVLRYVANEAKDDVDLSLILSSKEGREFEKQYSERLDWIYGGYAGQERRKWGVENMGLCLLIAWTNEIIQQGSGWHPDENLTPRENTKKIIGKKSS